jgi:hypothetical protein
MMSDWLQKILKMRNIMFTMTVEADIITLAICKISMEL